MLKVDVRMIKFVIRKQSVDVQIECKYLGHCPAANSSEHRNFTTKLSKLLTEILIINVWRYILDVEVDYWLHYINPSEIVELP
jgi:hypothetical protein